MVRYAPKLGSKSAREGPRECLSNIILTRRRKPIASRRLLKASQTSTLNLLHTDQKPAARAPRRVLVNRPSKSVRYWIQISLRL